MSENFIKIAKKQLVRLKNELQAATNIAEKKFIQKKIDSTQTTLEQMVDIYKGPRVPSEGGRRIRRSKHTRRSKRTQRSKKN